MEERIPLLRGKVGSEAKGVDKKISDLSQEWEAGRPLSKEHTPSEVTPAAGMDISEYGKYCRCLFLSDDHTVAVH